MEHAYIVKSGDLSRYADTRDSQGVIPELIYLLIRQSVSDASECRIPYGDAVNQAGLDGIVKCNNGYFQFVPDGISYWEIGTGGNPQDKANDDFRKRTSKLDDSERADTSFVFVTPRSAGANGWEEPEQSAWIKRRQNRGWKQIRIIDGVKLADWLREFPALGRWMASKIGITPSLGGIITPLEHWELVNVQANKSDPPLPPALFTTSRDGACSALEAVFTGNIKRLFLFAESEHDVDDFVAAYLSTLDEIKTQEYANRCLFINDENAWRTVSELRQSHVLVASSRLGLDSDKQDLQAVATSRGHGVIIPLCGALSCDNPEIIKLRSPSQSQIEEVLKKAQFSDTRARELGGIGGGRLSALRRYFLGLGSVPPYATWDTARELARACLIGQWNANNPADIKALEGLLGKDYGEWIEILRVDTLRSDSPLIQSEEKWRFVARGEVWSALGNRITDEDLDRLKDTAIIVLGERNPIFDLPKEERYAASIHGKQLVHSQNIRKGIVETLALVGSRPQSLSSCSTSKAETTAILVVRTLLYEASWERWASLDSHLPLLAETAPGEFLDAVESVLVDLPKSPFHKIFGQEGSGGFGDWNYMSGLLWALEGLAWHPDYLTRVAVILADIASIDPGGNWTNRPINSLVDIFLPWHIQTTAAFDKRKVAIKTVLKEQPNVGWSLLLALLPHSHGITSGCHRPVWREFIPRDWKEGVLQSEYWEQIIALTGFAVELAKEDSEKLVELVNRLSDLPKPAYDSVLNHLSTDEIVGLPESKRLLIWEKMDGIARQHRKFFDAEWAFPEEEIIKIEEIAKLLTPVSSALKFHHLFNERDCDLFDEKGNFEQQRKRLTEARQAAVCEILRDGDFAKCLDFAKTVASPYEVGCALGVIATDDVEDAILPAFLNSDDSTETQVVDGFIWARFWNFKINWVDTVLRRDWNPEQRAKFLTRLPFDKEIWDKVSSNLGESHEALYWRSARVNPYGRDRDLTVAIEKLLTYGREGAAVMCFACMADDTSHFDEILATRSLIAVIDSEEGIKELDNYHTVELIKRLQKSKKADRDALFRIEWSFLPWLDRFSSGSPITLEKRLASDPAFFSELVGLVFRSKKDNDDCANEHSEQKQHLARNAYKLLTEWKRCPGIQEDGTLDVKEFNEWINEARRITEETGHAEVAQIQIGHVLTYAPPDLSGLWIHEAVATALNYRDTGQMRSGFTTECFNQRGVHNYTHGQEEREFAKQNREKAEALDSRGFTRFATAMREFAEQYNRQAEQEEKRDFFDE
ncbi:hypothetical protein [Acetobacterium malicum]|uniref:hypothetical protein n=1 Tax=Acetobacterium malicum TaxID=52692 RepID=UPI0004261A19|nr:hypothetical protein [Acetobacterium dehalogenans]